MGLAEVEVRQDAGTKYGKSTLWKRRKCYNIMYEAEMVITAALR